MPIQIVSDASANAPKLIHAVLNDSTPFLSTKNGETYSAAAAPANAGIIDITFFHSDHSGNNIASPRARNDAGNYSRFAINWGQVATEFRLTDYDADVFNDFDDESQLSVLFEELSPTVVPNNPDGSRFNEHNGTLQAGAVVAFRGAGGKYGIILIKNSNSGSSLNLHIKVEN